MRTKLIVLTMPDNIWRILETAGMDMSSFYLNFGQKNYNWPLSMVGKKATEEDLRGVRQVPKPSMAHKEDGLVMLMSTIPITQLARTLVR